MKALKEIGYNGDITLEIRPFIEKYASKGLLEPALKFAEAVGRKLVSMYL